MHLSLISSSIQEILYMVNIGIDTMYINCPISQSEFSRLKVQLEEALGEKFHPERKHKQDSKKQTEEKYLKNTFITYAYAKLGFQKIRLRKIHRDGVLEISPVSTAWDQRDATFYVK
ncbi:hypothetical protein PVOR_26323 [Paenibacillus vortex V453]|jgi:hypothetical protein|uniref:Uncharacterized protein n=1 Tax=Paenibacillus vortex V453 TaxID=715225 RepID=A0A2R9SP31_9BACL|nr:hypothetical protein B9D94_06960 [Paenibacillus sp. Cedars]EFU39119.1 hypothetical protein PVOR_26323 [Paenibacillus vortex V453]